MRCPGCGTENRAGIRFCVQCGANLTRACASCGAAYNDGERFCGECGSALSAGVTAARPAITPNHIDATARSAERRHVTVLFADLVGFTPLSQQRDQQLFGNDGRTGLLGSHGRAFRDKPLNCYREES